LKVSEEPRTELEVQRRGMLEPEPELGGSGSVEFSSGSRGFELEPNFIIGVAWCNKSEKVCRYHTLKSL
jgi:hypothetical protein